MNRFRRWTVSIGARFDELLAGVENHEALAEQALIEMRQNLGRAEGQFRKVERDCIRLRESARAARVSEEKWKERAKRESDEERALECLRRSRKSRDQGDQLEAQGLEEERMRDQVRSTISSLEEKFRKLKNKKQLLSTRSAASRAAQAVEGDCASSELLEDVFGRWESSLYEDEFVVGAADAQSDELERGYDDADERSSLALELHELRSADSAQEADS